MGSFSSPNYGLLTDMANGIREGMISYQTMSNMKHQQQLSEMASGVTRDANGEMTFTPEKQQQIALQKMQTQRSMDKLDPESDLSHNTTTLSRGLIHDADGSIIPDHMSAEDINGESGLVGKYLSGQQADKKLQAMQDLGQKRLDMQQQMGNQRMNLQKDKFDYTQDKEARGTANNDSLLKMYSQRLEGASKINELLDAAKTGKVVSNQALLGQVNAEIARLETGSQSPGLGASEKTELNDRKAQLQSFIDSFTGDPQAAVNPKVLDTAGKMVSELTGSYQRGLDARNAYLKSGMNARQQGILNDKSQTLQQTYAPRTGGWDKGGGGQQQLSPEDQAAVSWAQANKSDPRAAQILKLHGM